MEEFEVSLPHKIRSVSRIRFFILSFFLFDPRKKSSDVSMNIFGVEVCL